MVEGGYSPPSPAGYATGLEFNSSKLDMVSIFKNLVFSFSWNTLGLGGLRLVLGVGKIDGLSNAALEWIVRTGSRFHCSFLRFPFAEKNILTFKEFYTYCRVFAWLPMGSIYKFNLIR